MSFLNEKEIDYPCTVSVSRPKTNFTVSGDYDESFDTLNVLQPSKDNNGR